MNTKDCYSATESYFWPLIRDNKSARSILNPRSKVIDLHIPHLGRTDNAETSRKCKHFRQDAPTSLSRG